MTNSQTGIPDTAPVVIIGGGAVGVSGLYHLAKSGWRDCVLLEKNELTAGSTWHAAGNCPIFSPSWAVMNMQRYSLELYRRLADEVDYPMNYHVTGSVRLAHSDERMREFERVAAMGRYQGVQMDICTPAQLQQHYPFLELHDLAGGLYDPLDGDIDPAQLTQALAKGARQLGQRVVRFTPATGVHRDGNEWVVETDKGVIRCEYVVNAAGYCAPGVGQWFIPYGGRTVPSVVMSHQYFLTEPVPEIQAWSTQSGRKLPLLRDVDSSYYLRQEKYGFNLGPYERNCRAHWVDGEDPMPEDFSFQLFPDDLDRLECYIEDAMARVPLLATQGVGRVINGPIPYAPDGLPLLGPMPGVRNAFEAHSFTFGIVQAGGAGKVLAEYLTQGCTEWDMWAVDPRRYTAYATRDYTLGKAKETYAHEYAMHFPHHEWPAGRGQRRSPLYDRLKGLGAQFGAHNGWERANWFAAAGDDTSEESTLTWARKGPWEPRVRDECLAVRDGAGVLELCGFSRFELSGPGAAAWLNRLIAGRLPGVGRLGLGYFADDRGRVVTEMSILRRAANAFTLITAAAAQWHDLELLANALPQSMALVDRSDEIDTLVVTGPESRLRLAALSHADLSGPWLTYQDTSVAGCPVRLVRVSFAGELGWEVHTAKEHAPTIYDALLAGGARPFGMFALNRLRLEKGYRRWKGDLSSDYSLLEAGLARFIDWSKLDFVGRSALLAERERGPKRRFVTLLVESAEFDPPYMATVWHEDEVVGETTSGGYGYRVNACIALGIVRADLAEPGQSLQVDIFGVRCPAVVQADEPLWDPHNERLRA